MEDPVSTVVFANSCAGGGKAAGRIAQVRAQFARRNFAVKLAECGSLAQFRTSIQAAVASGARRLVAMGGDGTLQWLVRETIGFDVVVGVIPVGGGNDVVLGILEIRQHAPEIEINESRLRIEKELATCEHLVEGHEALFQFHT